MGERNARQAVEKITEFIQAQHLEQASVNHIAADFKAATRGTVPFILRDVSDARRRLQSRPLTQPLLKENPMDTKKVVGLASGTKPLPVEVKPHTIALAPKPPPVIVPPPPPPEPVKPPPPPVKVAVEPRLLLSPTGNVAACTSADLSEAVDELAQQERCDPTAIVVYRPVKVRVTRLIEVNEEG
jgi:hypothetical protein